jgi:hypothetical protein
MPFGKRDQPRRERSELQPALEQFIGAIQSNSERIRLHRRNGGKIRYTPAASPGAIAQFTLQMANNSPTGSRSGPVARTAAQRAQQGCVPRLVG